ncbi:MAG: GGDEF domain-containing protein [Erysipelotrichaceae bacterium]|nr:GGDEF domain-containing protein [Erysipelotrichaceae bacterium]
MNRYHRFVTNNYHFKPDEPEYWQTYLINNILLILIPIFLFLFFFNIFIQRWFIIIIIDVIAMLISLFLMLFFHKTNDVAKTSKFSVALYTSLMVAYVLISGPKDYAFAWILVLPPLSYFLLGRNAGRFVTMFSLIFIFVGILFFSLPWKSDTFNLVSFVNLLFATICVTILISFSELSRAKAYDFIQLKNEELMRLSHTDALTGISNRLKLDEVMMKELARVRRGTPHFSIIMGDLDLFKHFNDSYGHLVGDQILVEIASAIVPICRLTDTVGRWGGEEFLVICPETSTEGAMVLAEKIRKAVESLPLHRYGSVTISLGVTSSKTDDDINTIVMRADKALYIAKSDGRNQVRSMQSTLHQLSFDET